MVAAMLAGTADFTALPHRLQVVHDDGRLWVDDSIATIPEATVAALAAFPDRPVTLLAGGFERGQDHAPLVAALADRASGAAPVGVVALPDTGHRLARDLASRRGSTRRGGGGGGGPGRGHGRGDHDDATGRGRVAVARSGQLQPVHLVRGTRPGIRGTGQRPLPDEHLLDWPQGPLAAHRQPSEVIVAVPTVTVPRDDAGPVRVAIAPDNDTLADAVAAAGATVVDPASAEALVWSVPHSPDDLGCPVGPAPRHPVGPVAVRRGRRLPRHPRPRPHLDVGQGCLRRAGGRDGHVAVAGDPSPGGPLRHRDIVDRSTTARCCSVRASWCSAVARSRGCSSTCWPRSAATPRSSAAVETRSTG